MQRRVTEQPQQKRSQCCQNHLLIQSRNCETSPLCLKLQLIHFFIYLQTLQSFRYKFVCEANSHQLKIVWKIPTFCTICILHAFIFPRRYCISFSRVQAQGNQCQWLHIIHRDLAQDLVEVLLKMARRFNRGNSGRGHYIPPKKQTLSITVKVRVCWLYKRYVLTAED